MNFIYRTRLLLFCLIAFTGVAAAQSTDQNFPTSVTSNQIVGQIKARDIGDPRLTSLYYAFDGVQGDIFINVVTRNFVGDIDVFTRDSLRPLTKIVVFDSGANETGRLIYLRKQERLLLRIQGRTPGDEAANFQIKFAGSFIALKPAKDEPPPTISDEDGSNVNTVGTKLPPKPVETKPVATVEKKPEPVKEAPASEVKRVEPKSEEPKASKPEVVVGSTIRPPLKIEAPAKTPPRTTAAKKPAPEKRPAKEKAPDPLASIKLMILMKDGSVIERQMNEVVRFSVDKGILVVILKDGGISRFPIVDVARVTIE
jgi:hypothetical protein